MLKGCCNQFLLLLLLLYIIYTFFSFKYPTLFCLYSQINVACGGGGERWICYCRYRKSWDLAHTCFITVFPSDDKRFYCIAIFSLLPLKGNHCNIKFTAISRGAAAEATGASKSIVVRRRSIEVSDWLDATGLWWKASTVIAKLQKYVRGEIL